MKKISIIAISTLLSACVNSTPQDTRSVQEQYYEQYTEQAKNTKTTILATTDIMDRISQIKTVYRHFQDYDANDNSFKYEHGEAGWERDAYIQEFMEAGEFNNYLKCFISIEPPLFKRNDSDECILARRNVKANELGNFDYAALLPEGHKINSVEAFKDLLGAYHYYYNSWDYVDADGKWQHKPTQGQEDYVWYNDGYRCSNNSQQLTSVEIENCKNNINQYITDKVMGNLKSCKDVAPKAYKALFTVTDEDIQAAKGANAMISNLGLNKKSEADFIASMVEDFRKKDAPEFGYKYRCKMENWENDYKNWISKIEKAAKQTKKSGKVISLN